MRNLNSLKYLIGFLLLLQCTMAFAATSANDVINNAYAKIQKAKGISGAFSITSGSGNLNGTLKASGVKFAIQTPSYSTWYDGKKMWTLNAASKETTLVLPTASEIAESNPLEYLKSYKSNYTASFSSQKIAGKYVVTLVAKKKKDAIKQVDIYIDNKSMKPEQFIITQSSGTVTKIIIKSLDYSVSLKNSDFIYPQNKYPKYQIIDLR